VEINTVGDQQLDKPLYELGIQGVFTKALDTALLNKQIDIAVHSYKDVPTSLAKGLVIGSVLKRADSSDSLLGALPDESELAYTIATSSLRRRAQWLKKFPHHQTASIRGNVGTRIKKLHEQPELSGLIMATAALDRIEYDQVSTKLTWMLPAPAQGAICIACNADDQTTLAACATLTHRETALATTAERAFLRQLNGGCTLPCGALAHIRNDTLSLSFGLFSLDGSEAIEMQVTGGAEKAEQIGIDAADQLLENGGTELLNRIRNTHDGQ